MIDIVTIAFEDELGVLQVQAQSIDLYCKDLGIQSIYVVVNDTQAVADQINPAWWGSLQDRVRIIQRDTFSTKFVKDGWISQQALKILASTVSFNEWTMVVDAKTLFVKTVNPDEIIASSNQLTWGYAPIQEVFASAGQTVSQLFGIDLKHVAMPMGVPFMFHTRTVREMVSEVEQRTGQSFPEWFQHQVEATEFILYTGFVQFKYGLDQMYLDTHRFPVCNICHSEVDSFERKFAEMLGNVYTVSIHRKAWMQITEEQRTQYRTLLQQRQLTRAELL
jgi:hypothetical protein